MRQRVARVAGTLADRIGAERRDGGLGSGPGDRGGLVGGIGAVSAIRLIIVDDHPVVRDGLRGMLAGDPGLEVIGEASDGAEALALAEVAAAGRHPDGPADARPGRRGGDPDAGGARESRRGCSS